MHEILSLQRMLSVEVIYFSRDREKAFLQSWERSVFPFAVSITPKRLVKYTEDGQVKKLLWKCPHYEKKNTACISLFNHWRKDCERNNAVVVKPQEQRKSDLTPFLRFSDVAFRTKPRLFERTYLLVRQIGARIVGFMVKAPNFAQR